MSDFDTFMQQQALPKPGAAGVSPITGDVAAPAPVAPQLASAAPAPADSSVSPAPPADPFADFIKKSIGDQTHAAASQVTVANAQTPAATAAAAAPIGRQLGLPQSAVETDVPHFQQQAQIQQANTTLAANPVLAKWVAANPDGARIAQNEYPQLGKLEQIWDGDSMQPIDMPAGSAAQVGKAAGDYGYTAVQQLGKSFSDSALAVNRMLGVLPALGDAATGGSGLTDWWQRNMIQPRTTGAASLNLAPDASFGQKTVGGVANLLGLLSQIELTGGGGGAEALPATAGALETLGTAAAHAAKSMAFPSLTSAVNMGQDVYDKTGDSWAAAKASIGSYFTTTLQGLVPFSAPGGLATRMVTGAASAPVTSEVSRQAMNLLLPEEMQSKFDPQEALFNAAQGAMFAGVMGPHPDRQGDVYKAARDTYTQSLAAESAERDMGKIQQLSEIAANSKLREADPEAFHEFVRTVTDDSDLDAVYVDAKHLSESFAQSAVAADVMPDVKREMGEAMLTGGDVRIPIADYATHIAGTDLEKMLMPRMKAQPDGMTFEEGQQHFADAQKNLEAKAKEMGDQRQQQVDLDADKQTVHDKVLEQLAATGRNPDSVNKAYAKLVSEFYGAQAGREGMKPSELFAQHPLHVGAESIAGRDALAQNAAYGQPDRGPDGSGLPADKDLLPTVGGGSAAPGWAGATRLSREGQPVVLHHGGAVPLAAEHFDPASLGSASGKPSSGLGVYFTPNKGEASSYGKSEAFHLDIRNPKVIKADELPGFDSVQDAHAYREQLRAQGHDGIIISAKHLGGPVHAVAFDPDQVIYPKSRGGEFSQGERGSYSPDTKTISLLKTADLSTFLHESGHFFLDMAEHIAGGEGASEGAKADFDTLLKSFGEKGDTPEERMASWQSKSLDEKRAGHEQFAEGFEKYLMEGKAPSTALQPLFSRFRSWLLNVYRGLTGQGVELTPEVRQVMDRMLASDTAIKEAEQQRGYAPLFTDAKTAGMTDAEFQRYQELGQRATDAAVNEMDAKSMKDMQWLSNAKSKALAKVQREAKAARKEAHVEAEQEVAAQPIEQARNFLARGELTEADRTNRQRKALDTAAGASTKLDIDALKELYGDGPAAPWRYLATGKDGLTGKGGIDPEIAAEIFGFKSADDLVRGLLETNTKEKVEQLTDQKMLEKHGELTDPQAIQDAANAAVHNEARARFMATGLKALTESPLPAGQIARAAKEAAERIIAGKKTGELRSDRYLAAESRANREALASAAKDPKKAIEAQRAALLNNRLARAAQDAQDEVQKGLAYLKKFDKPAVAGKVGADYMDRINELLSNYDLAKRSNQDVAGRQSLRAWLDAKEQETGVRPEVPDNLQDLNATNWKELSVEDFRGLVDSVKSLEHVGRAATQITLDGKALDLDTLVDEARASMATMAHSPPVNVQPHLAHAEGLDKISAQFLAGKSKLRSMDAALLKMEQLFQMLDAGGRAGLGDSTFGAFSKIFKRMSKAEAAERGMRADSVADLRALGDKLKDAGVNLHEALDVGLLRPGRGTHWYREELLAAALNTGNASNLKKLAEGYGWQEGAVVAQLDKHMSKPEWDFVQGVWDAVGKYGPQISELQRRLTGVAPDMIKPQSVRTQHGEFEGGYYPLVYDAFQDAKIDDKNAKNTDMLFENQWGQPTTSKGHTVQRTGYVGPLQLSLGVISRHLDQVTHDLAWREPVIDANKFLSDDRVKSEIDQVMGREYTKQLRPWLQALANDKVFNTSGDSGWENFYRKARSNATIVGLGFRLSTMQIHGLSALSTSLGEVGAKWMAKGAAQFAGIDRWQNARDFVYERSPEMANRMNEVDRNVHEAIDEINARALSFGPRSIAQMAVDGAKKYAFYGVSMLDMASAMPTWHGAYLKGMAKEGEGGLNMSEDDAIEYANRAVRNAHGGGGVKDLAAVQRDKGAMSLATMFYSFWNHMYNRQRDLGKGYANLPQSFADGTGTKDFARLLGRSWYYFVVPQLIHALLKPDPQDAKEDDGSLGHFLGHAAKEVGLGFVSGVPVLRDLANAAVNGRDYTITPLESAGKAVVKTATDAYKIATGDADEIKHPVKDIAQGAGYTFGLPTGQASNTAQFLWDVVSGEADPQGLKDWYQGLTTGKIGDSK